MAAPGVYDITEHNGGSSSSSFCCPEIRYNLIQGEHKKVIACDFCWYFSNACRFLHEIWHSCMLSNKKEPVADEIRMQTWTRQTEVLQIHFTTKFCWNTCANDIIMLFQPRYRPFLSVPASCRTGCKRTVTIGKNEWPSSSPDLNPLHSRMVNHGGKVPLTPAEA